MSKETKKSSLALNGVIPILVTSLIMGAITFIGQMYLGKNNVEIFISDKLQESDTSYIQSISIINYKSYEVSDVSFYLPDASIRKLINDSSIDIKKSNNKFIINKIYSKSNNTITVKFLDPNNKSDGIKCLMEGHSGYDVIYGDETNYFRNINYFLVILNAIFLALILLAVNFFKNYTIYLLELKSDSLKEDIANSKEMDQENKRKIEELNLSRKELDKRIETTNSRIGRLKIISYKQIADLRKENDYYKNLLNELIRESKLDSNLDIHTTVTKTLKTYTTQSKFVNENNVLEELSILLHDKPKIK